MVGSFGSVFNCTLGPGGVLEFLAIVCARLTLSELFLFCARYVRPCDVFAFPFSSLFSFCIPVDVANVRKDILSLDRPGCKTV
jgi:hypothetical protein